MYHIISVQSSVDGYLLCLQDLPIRPWQNEYTDIDSQQDIECDSSVLIYRHTISDFMPPL